MSKFVIWFAKVTGYIPYMLHFKPKVYYLDKNKQSKKIKGSAILISNHISVIDFILIMMIFVKRNIRVLVGEVLFNKNKLLTWFLNKIGAIKVDRYKNDISFTKKILKTLKNDGVLHIFPEGRLPTAEEKDLLPFKPGYVYFALRTKTPIIPIYMKRYYKKNNKTIARTDMLIGEPILLNDLLDETKQEKENIEVLNQYVYDYMKSLGNKLEDLKEQKKKKM